MKNILIVVILIALGVAAWYLLSVRQVPEEADLPSQPVIVEEKVPPPAPQPRVAEPVEVIPPAPPPEPVVEEPPLPPLEESDSLVIETLSGLIGEAPVRQFMAHENVVPRLVATVNALSARQVPASIKAVEGPGGEFQATADEDPTSVILNDAGDPIPQYVLDPVNYQRYTPYVDALDAASAEQLVTAYREYQPLFDEAFSQLGYPEGDFEERLRAVIDELLATPDVTDPVRLIKPEAFYLYAEEDLEALSAGQKTLVRMGPENAARVKAKLIEIRDAL